jgi:hypothetical protein
MVKGELGKLPQAAQAAVLGEVVLASGGAR